jgi:hypothetical protein
VPDIVPSAQIGAPDAIFPCPPCPAIPLAY